MPPIMGAAAFLMTEYVGEPYSEIAMRAILPAVLYFLGIFIAVHLEAKKSGLKVIPRSELPKFNELINKVYLLAPLKVLIYLQHHPGQRFYRHHSCGCGQPLRQGKPHHSEALF